MIGDFPAVLDFNRLFLKLNRFTPIIETEHSGSETHEIETLYSKP